MTRLCSLFFAFLLCPAFLIAQPQKHSGGPPPPKAMPPSGNVTIDVTVTDKSGKPVLGLRQQDFSILDDKQEKTPSIFRAVDLQAETPAPPQELVLVIDAINAGVTRAAEQRNGIKRFLESNAGKLPIPVSFITITDEGLSSPIPASRDGNALAARLDQSATGLRTVNRTTAFGAFERYELSLKTLGQIIDNEAPKPGRKLIVWVSPGWPWLTRTTEITNMNQRQLFRLIVKTSTALRLGHITLYNVIASGVDADVAHFWNYAQYVPGVKSESHAYPPNLALPVLATQSGGLVLNGSNDLPAAMAAEIARSAADAQAFYVITFPASPAEHQDEYHSLQVKVNRPGVTVRTQAGYYAQPQ